MNYEKKRKRQSGRQSSSPKAWIDEWERLNTQIERLIAEGELPKISYDPIPMDMHILKAS